MHQQLRDLDYTPGGGQIEGAAERLGEKADGDYQPEQPNAEYNTTEAVQEALATPHLDCNTAAPSIVRIVPAKQEG